MGLNIFCFFFLAILSISAVDAAHHHATAPSPSSSSSTTPAVDCSTLILNMADCLSFVSSGSEVSKPEGTCCSGLKTVLKRARSAYVKLLRAVLLWVSLLMSPKPPLCPPLAKFAPSATNCALSVTPTGAPDVQPSATAGAPTASSESTNEMAPGTRPRQLSLFGAFGFGRISRRGHYKYVNPGYVLC
ncbi:Detected protein of unknown function [Hibiscus syriacus]|uniref:Bifunctional inhibitor/plant lipid transfer protein/seed storage helical domain-containing protein n=1 Tax=Hibiscus syriacus TaxID=106335 RepID=A0A6A3BUC1_HIBSY|nr:Detected protein of unknown function [Hibiscus syriacus]